MSFASTSSSAVHPSRSNGASHFDRDSDVPHGLDDLLALDHDRLTDLYAAATVPDLAAISGDLRGRMLAIPSLGTNVEGGRRGAILARAIKRFAASRRFPWLGKSFTPAGDDRGEGVNRVFSDRLKLFRFETRVARSLGGDFDAVQLDYDRPGNPFFIRAIKDEIRELRPGLYLGQAWILIGKRRPVLGLWFGLEHTP